jgi:hypothetical protein
MIVLENAEEMDLVLSVGVAGLEKRLAEMDADFLLAQSHVVDPGQLAELTSRKKAVHLLIDRILSFFTLWQAARKPFEVDGEWKGQGAIANAERWIELLKFCSGQQECPELIDASRLDARNVFHFIKEQRDTKLREADQEYARFIAAADVIADQVRELID